MNALVKNSHELKLENLSDRKLLAIAQHYGFYTHLLDFTRNLEVAAYFGTYTEQPPRIGVVFAFPIDEYNSLRNPFAALGASLDMAEEALGDLALPPILDEDFDDVPRIYEQEGVFIECPVDKTKTIQDNCGQTNLAVHDAPMGLNFEGRALVSKAYQTRPAPQ